MVNDKSKSVDALHYLFGISLKESVRKIEEVPQEIARQCREGMATLLKDINPFSALMESTGRTIDLIQAAILTQLREVRKLLQEMEAQGRLWDVPPVQLWRAIIKSDDKAIPNFLDSKPIDKMLSKAVTQLRGDDMDVNRETVERKVYEMIDERREYYYDHPEEREAYSDDQTVRVFVQNLQSFWRQNFVMRLNALVRRIEIEHAINKGVDKLTGDHLVVASVLQSQMAIRGWEALGLETQGGGVLLMPAYGVHPKTGESLYSLKQVVRCLSLSEKQLRDRLRNGQIPRRHYYRYKEVFHGFPSKKLQLTNPYLFTSEQIEAIRALLIGLKIKSGMLATNEAGAFVAIRKEIKRESAVRWLKKQANRKNLRAKKLRGKWHYPITELKKILKKSSA